MSFKIVNIKLKYQLIILIAIALLMTILVQFFYYYRFHLLIQEKENISNQNIMIQVEENLSASASAMKKAAFAISYDFYVQQYLIENQPLKRIELNKIVSGIMNYVSSSSNSINDILLMDNKERKTSLISGYNYKLSNTLIELYEKNAEYFRKGNYCSVLRNDDNELCFAYLLPVYLIGDEKKIGLCIIVCKLDFMQELIKKISLTENSLFLITDAENTVAASNNLQLRGETPDELELTDYEDGNRQISYKNNKCMLYYHGIPETGWKIINITPLNDLTIDMKTVTNFGIKIGIVFTVLIIITGFIFIRSITLPVNELIYFMEHIGKNNINSRIPYFTSNEIGKLSCYINKMLDNIEEMTNKVMNAKTTLYETQLAHKQAELIAFQSQINPHFLYNTLECIRSIAFSHNMKSIVDISISMAKIFRYSIKGGDYVEVRDEVECISDYLTIMKIRHENRFKFTIDIHEQIYGKKILKMILQPLVENAVFHGLEQKNGQGSLMITGRFIEGSSAIRFEITDSGKGIAPAELTTIRKYISAHTTGDLNRNKRCLGLINISRRIRLFYGVNSSFEIFSKLNEGTKVVLVLPLA